MNEMYHEIMGLVVGDALGVPVEFAERDTYRITGMTGLEYMLSNLAHQTLAV